MRSGDVESNPGPITRSGAKTGRHVEDSREAGNLVEASEAETVVRRTSRRVAARKAEEVAESEMTARTIERGEAVVTKTTRGKSAEETTVEEWYRAAVQATERVVGPEVAAREVELCAEWQRATTREAERVAEPEVATQEAERVDEAGDRGVRRSSRSADADGEVTEEPVVSTWIPEQVEAVTPVTGSVRRARRRAERSPPPEEGTHANHTAGSTPQVEEASGPRCKGCWKLFNKRTNPFYCVECKHGFHLSHTGETRAKMEKIRKLGRPWTCGYCRLGVESVRPQTRDGPAPGQCMAQACRNRRIRRGDDFLSCTGCLGQLHKKRSWTNMTAGEISRTDRATWKCEGCLGMMAGEQVEEETTAPSFKVKSKNFISQLTILQWNCDHLLAKIEELRVYLEKRNVDVFFIQETKLISSDKRIKSKFPGYTIKRKDRAQPRGKEGNRGGGLLVGIKKGIPFRVANIDLRGYGDGITESYSIEIPLKNGQKIRFTNIYIPPIRNTSSEAERQRDTEVTTNKWPCERYDCLFGDFNAHAPVWDSSYEEADERGEIIDDWIRGTGMTTLNDPDSPTRIDRRDDENIQRKDTSPDISVVHSSMADRFTVWKTDNHLGSDHLPIVIRYEDADAIPSVTSKPQYRWNLKDASWSDFTADVERRIPTNYQAKSARKLERLLRRAIIAAANKFVRKKRIDNNTKPHLTKELREAIRKRNRLRATRVGNRKEWTEAARKVVELVKTTREQKWKEYVGTLNMSTNPAQVWRTIHSLEGKHPAKSENEVLTFEGEALVDDSSKAKAFAKT